MKPAEEISTILSTAAGKWLEPVDLLCLSSVLPSKEMPMDTFSPPKTRNIRIIFGLLPFVLRLTATPFLKTARTNSGIQSKSRGSPPITSSSSMPFFERMRRSLRALSKDISLLCDESLKQNEHFWLHRNVG